MSWQQRISAAIEVRRAADALRVRTVVENGSRPFLSCGQRRYRNFSSNDYLGLSQHPAVIFAWQESARRFGVGSGGSGHVIGYTVAHQQLEETLAQWLGYPRALLFISGFAANQAVITALTGKADRIVADRLSHASLLEAANLSQAQLRRFAHNDTTSLDTLLSNACSGQQLVVTEGVFSMDGDSAPLAAIHAIAKREKAWLMVDDAHGIGVLGRDGRGSCDAQRVKPELLIVTFGKSVGISGAAVLCDDEVAQYLLQFASHLIYSTSMPPAQAVALQAAIDVIRSDEGDRLRRCLAQHIRIFREGASQLMNGQLTTSHSAIQPLIVGDNARVLQIVQRLQEAGIWTTAMRPPTVPVGTARLRLTLTASHEQQDITALLEALHDIG